MLSIDLKDISGFHLTSSTLELGEFFDFHLGSKCYLLGDCNSSTLVISQVL